MFELVSLYSEKESLGDNQYRLKIYQKPIAFFVGSVLTRINSDWADSGISARPSMVSASQLMVSVSDEGDLRAHPTREDNKYLEFGAPLIKVAGEWIRPGFSNRTRDGNRLEWTTDYENAYLVHAGYYLKWGILLKNNFDRWSQFAMPVGLTGLTRIGGTLYDDGTPVMCLRKPVVYDYDNDEDVRQINHEFIQQDGQWYVLFTLPDLTGMSRPLIDPTLELQPDASAGIDTYIKQGSGDDDDNYGVNTKVSIGGNYLGEPERTLTKFILSGLPESAIVSDAQLKLYCYSEDNSSNYQTSIYRSLVVWFEGIRTDSAPAATDGSTWNHKNANTGGQTSWGTAGGQSGTDYYSTATSSEEITGTSAWFTWDVTDDVVDFVAETYSNYGWFINPDSPANDSRKYLYSSDYTTPALRPELVITYTMPARTPSTSDSVAVTESASTEITPEIPVGDNISVTESVSATISDPQVDVSDSVTVAENADIHAGLGVATMDYYYRRRRIS